MLQALTLCVLSTLTGVLAGNAAFKAKCLAFVPEATVANSTRHVLEYIPAGTNLTLSDNDPSCARTNQVVDVETCRVGLSIPTSNRSSISFELWLPADWSGRFMATGNGGVNGCIMYEDLAYTIKHGFAAVGSNNGHNGTSLITAYGNSDVITDFSYRALHLSTTIGKSLVQAFYSRNHTHSYLLGASLGGRQGINAADKFPSDYDGIVAGAPALDFNNLISWRASFYPLTGPPGAPTFIPRNMWTTLINNAVLTQCDTIDGALDGIIEDPNRCHLNVEPLLCRQANVTANCLTLDQARTVLKIFSPLYSEDGKFIFPGMQPGSEVLARDSLYTGAPFPYSSDWFRYVVYTPDWDPAAFTTHDAAVAEALNPADVRTWPSTLAAFRDKGGKIITYHGLQDDQITSFNTERFYKHLEQGMNATSADLDHFFRFFKVPGMGHVRTGPGAFAIGQGTATPEVEYDATHNVLAAVVRWVENGTAPNTIIGTKFKGDVVENGVVFQHRHCKYPAKSTYLGGDVRALESWKCV